MEMKVGNRYLCEEVNYSSHYHQIVEFACLEISGTSIKVKNLITEHIGWKDKSEFQNESNFGYKGYFIKEDLGVFEMESAK